MSIRITSDSSVDLSKELIEKYNIEILPFNILMNDTEYLDGININNQMIEREDIKLWIQSKSTTLKDFIL